MIHSSFSCPLNKLTASTQYLHRLFFVITNPRPRKPTLLVPVIDQLHRTQQNLAVLHLPRKPLALGVLATSDLFPRRVWQVPLNVAREGSDDDQGDGQKDDDEGV
jgi:hypothetical protein